MHDPDEGISATGMIVTGAGRRRVPAAFEPVVASAIEEFEARVEDRASLLVYGSVATGMAQVGSSDVDLLTVGVPAHVGAELSRLLSDRFANRCRSVDAACCATDDLVGDRDEAYGNRVFLRHYCVTLAGDDPVDRAVDFPADVRAARGFNGDIGRHLDRWRTELDAGSDPSELARVAARKSLLAVAGLVSVHDRTWTTDRLGSARRWATIDRTMSDGLAILLGWIENGPGAPRGEVDEVLAGPITAIVAAFDRAVGLWE